MAKYYYLVASLPYIEFGEPPGISEIEFKEECAKWLTGSDLDVLFGRGFRGNDTAAELDGLDRKLREDLALIRTARKKGESPKVPEYLKETASAENPLLMERAVERARWNWAEEKSAGRFFDVGWLICYFSKLKISQRLSSFDKDRGEALFYEFCEVDHDESLWKNTRY